MLSIKKLFLSSLIIGASLFASELDEEKMKQGEWIYKETCVSCHGVDGKAQTNLNLVVKPRDLTQTLLDEEQTYLITKDGAHHWGAKSDIMPAFKSTYNEEELRAVAYYITNKFNPDLEARIKKLCSECEPPPKDQDKKMKKWGKKIYFRNCMYCHGMEGYGNGDATKNPVDSIYPYDLTKTLLTKKQIFLYVKYGGKHFGTDKEDMPSWKRKYNDFKLRSVARFVDEELRGNKQ